MSIPPDSAAHPKDQLATTVQASHIQVGGAEKVKEAVSLDHSLAVTDFQVRCIITEKSNVSA